MPITSHTTDSAGSLRRCVHGSYAGRPIRGRLCHVLRAPSRAAATPHTVHDAYAPFAVSGRWLAGGRRGLAVGTGLLSLGLGLYLAFQIGFVDGLFLGPTTWTPR